MENKQVGYMNLGFGGEICARNIALEVFNM